MPRFHRCHAGACVAILIAGAVGACGSGSAQPDKAALVSKLKAGGSFKGASEPQLNCIAGVIMKHVSSGDVKKFVDGKVSELPDPTDGPRALADVQKCKDAT
jgi:hypothetical protein